MKTKGRPIGSDIRYIVHKILSVIHLSYPYEIFRIIQIGYSEIKCTQRVIYYNIDVGIKEQLWKSKSHQIFNVGNSWEGSTGRNILYILKPIKVNKSETQMIKEIYSVVKKVLNRDKNLKLQFKEQNLKTFKQMFETLKN